MEAAAIPEIKEAIRRLTIAEAEAIATQALGCDSAEAVEELLARELAPRLIDLLERKAADLSKVHVLVIDEAANIAPLGQLDRYAATCRAIGVQLVTVWQDLAQIEERYGRARAATILNNHRGVIALSSIKDPATLDYLCTLLGEEEVPHISTTLNGSGEQITTEATRRQHIAGKAALRHLDHGRALAIYGHHDPFHLSLPGSSLL